MEQWVNPVTLLAYIFLTGGTVFQIGTTLKANKADDINILEVIGRFIAQLLIMWKVLVVGDGVLIWGHGILTVVYSFYLLLVLKCKYLTKLGGVQ